VDALQAGMGNEPLNVFRQIIEVVHLLKFQALNIKIQRAKKRLQGC